MNHHLLHVVLILGVLTPITWAGDTPQEHWVPLKTKIPEVVYSGRRIPIKLPNLEPIEVEQKPFLVPRGLKNVALGKAVTSSDLSVSEETLTRVTDNRKESTEPNLVQLEAGQQWIQIDLEKETEIFALWLWHRHHNIRAYRDVIVQVSNDRDFASGKEVTVYNNDHDNSSGLGKGPDKSYIETNRGRVIDTKKAMGRFIRIHSNGNTSNEMNHYLEVEVWGR